MENRFSQNEAICPECGHLMFKTACGCRFCGWFGIDLQPLDSTIDLKDIYSDWKNLSGFEDDIDRIIDSV